MKLKRVLATFLCAAMVLTSNSTGVYAAEDILLIQDTENNDHEVVNPVSANEADETVPEELQVDGVDDVISADTVSADSTGSEGSDDLVIPGDDPAFSATEEGSDVVTADQGGKPSDFLGVSEDGTLTVIGYDSIAATKAETVCIPAGVKKIPKDETLFYKNNVVKTVTFESGSTEGELVIDEGAFEGCSIVYFGGSDNYLEIKDGTFQNCTSLSEFNFRYVETIGNNAFNGCTAFGKSIDKLSGKGKIISIGEYAFASSGFTSLNISRLCDSFVEVGRGAFANSVSLEKVYIPESFASVPEACFTGCTNLNTLILHNNGTIGEQAFKGCNKLKTIDFGNTRRIESYAFQNCTALVTVEIPATLNGEGDNVVAAHAFDGCTGLTKATFNYKSTAGIVDTDLVEDEAFSGITPAKLTLAGYEGTLKAYADKYGYKWISLSDNIKIRITSNFATYCTAKITVNGKSKGTLNTGKDDQYFEAKPGEQVVVVIEVRPSIADKYGLVKNSLTDGKGTEFKFISYKDGKYTYTCKAPRQDMTLDIKTYPTEAVSKGKLSHSITPLEDAEFVPNKDRTSYTITYGEGKKGQLDINANYNDDSYTLGEWLFSYSSSDPKVATISDTGLITVLKDGVTTITATYKSNTNKKLQFQLNSDEKVYVDEDNFILEYDGTDGIIPDYFDTQTIRLEDDKEIEVQVVEYDVSDLNSSDQEFRVKLNARNQKNEAMFVNAAWASADKNIATVREASNMTNSNTVIIKKGTVGDTMITASTVTKSKDDNLKNVTITAYLIVRITDYTPKAVEDDITVNVAKRADDQFGGTQVTLVSVGDEEIDGRLLKLGGDVYEGLWKDTTGSNQFNGLRLKYVGENEYGQHVYRLIATGTGATANIAAKAKVEYSGKTQLYIRIARNNKNDFYVPLKKVLITNEGLAFNAKPSGAINILYDGKCYDPYRYNCDPELELKRKDDETDKDYIDRYVAATVGTVTIPNPVSQSVAKLWNVELVSKDHWEKITRNKGKYVEDPTDKFAANFTITPNNEWTSFTIRRTVGDMETIRDSNNKNVDVVSGYLYFRFQGYSTCDPASEDYRNGASVVPVTIPVKTAAPGYTLTPSTVTDSRYNGSGEYAIKIVNPSTKESAFVNKVLTSLEKDQSLNHKYFADLDTTDMDNEGVIKLTMNSMPIGKNKVAIKVKRVNWAKAVKYTFTANITDKTPTVKLAPTKVTLNNTLDESSAEIKLTLSQTGTSAYINGGPVYKGKGEEPDIEFDINRGKTANELIIIPKISAGTAAKGNYKYEITPQYGYGEQAARDLGKKLSFTVSVTDAQPSVKLSSSAYTFNYDKADYAGLEVYKPLMTFNGITVGEDDVPVLADVEIVPLKVKAAELDIAEEVAAAIKLDTAYNATKKKHELHISIDDISNLPMTKFSYNFEVRELKEFGAAIKPFKITVKGITAEPQVTIKASGKVNTVDDRSYVKYTATVKNLANVEIAENISVYEYDYDNGGRIESERFRAVRDEKNDKITCLYENIGPDEARFEDKAYELEFEYDVAGIIITTNTFKVKPVQTFSKYKLEPSGLKFASVYNSGRQVARVDLTKTTVLHSHISGVKLKDSNAKTMKRAFSVNYVDGDLKDDIPDNAKTCYAGYIEVTCVAPELLKKGTTYQLMVELEMDGQFQKEVKVKQNDGSYDYEWQKVKGPSIQIPVTVTR